MRYTVVLCESSIDHRLLAKSDTEALEMAKNKRFLGGDVEETIICIRNDDTKQFICGNPTDYYDCLDVEEYDT